MKKIFIILLFFCILKSYSQIDSIIVDQFYVDSSEAIIYNDSINVINGYPRQDALTYININPDGGLNKKILYINKVTLRYLKKYILDSLQYPVIKVNKDSVLNHNNLQDKLEQIIIDSNWYCYLKNENLWMFNVDTSKYFGFSVSNIELLRELNGKLFNFCLFASIPYTSMDNIINGYTVRQICNSMDQIIKRKDNNRIMIRLYRNGIYEDFEDIFLLIDNSFLLHTVNDVKNATQIYQLLEVNDVDEDVSSRTDYLTSEDF